MFRVLGSTDTLPDEATAHLLMVMLLFCHRLIHRQQQESQYALVPGFSPDQVASLLQLDEEGSRHLPEPSTADRELLHAVWSHRGRVLLQWAASEDSVPILG